jgi:hypothetical protein
VLAVIRSGGLCVWAFQANARLLALRVRKEAEQAAVGLGAESVCAGAAFLKRAPLRCALACGARNGSIP